MASPTIQSKTSAQPNTSFSYFKAQLKENFFPQSIYGKDTKATTHFQILSGNEANFNAWINPTKGTEKEIAEKTAQRVNSFATKMKLSPLHVAAMTGQTAMAKTLLGKGADVNARDARNWTPLHWAAATGDKSLMGVFLTAKGVQLDALNHRNGTFKDILRLTQLSDPSKQEFTYIDKTEKPVQADGGKFQELFGVKAFLDRDCYLKPEVLMEDWRSPTNFNHGGKSLARETYDSIRDNPPKTAAFRVKGMDGGWGWKSLEKIKRMTLFAEYYGEVESKARNIPDLYEIDTSGPHPKAKINVLPELMYRFPPVDALAYRGLAALANDSFSNAETREVYDLAGLGQRIFLIATKDIEPGEEILMSYGTLHPVRRSIPHMELNEAGMVSFWKKNRGSHVETLQRIKTSKPLDLYALNAYLYLFSTPTSLAICAAKCDFTIKDVIEVFEIFKHLDGTYLDLSTAHVTYDFVKNILGFVESGGSLKILLEKAQSLSGLQLVLFLEGNKNPTKEDVETYALNLYNRVRERAKELGIDPDPKKDDNKID